MNRRDFFATGLGGALGAVAFRSGEKQAWVAPDEEIRAAFPRMKQQTYLNAAGMMPLPEVLSRRRFFRSTGSRCSPQMELSEPPRKKPWRTWEL